MIKKAVNSLNVNLRVTPIYYRVESGAMNRIESKEELLSGKSFQREAVDSYSEKTKISVNQGVKYDLIGKLVDETGLTRRDVVDILKL